MAEAVESIYISNLPEEVDMAYLDDILSELELGQYEVKSAEGGIGEVTLKNNDDAEKLLKMKRIPAEVKDKVVFMDVAVSKEGAKKKERKSVVVKGLPPNTSQGVLKEYFSSKKRGVTGIIEVVKFQEGQDKAIIVYQDAGDAEIIARSTDLSLRHSKLEVDFFLDEDEDEGEVSHQDQCTVCMSGLTNELLDAELIQDAIEGILDKEAKINDLSFDEQECTAVIVLKDITTARQLVEVGTHTFAGVELKLTQYQPQKKKNTPEPDGVTILAKNMPTNLSDGKVKVYFESSRKKGGPVEYLQYDSKKGTAIVTYRKPADAERMLNNGNLDIKGNTVTLEWYIEEDQEEEQASVLVMNITDDMDEEFIEDLFSNEHQTGGGDIDKVQIININQALVTFAKSTVAERVLKRRSVELYDGHTLKIISPSANRSAPKTKVFVTGAEGLVGERLKLFLENRKRGGPIESINSGPQKGSFLIEFVEVKDAENVAKLGDVKIGQTVVHIELYEEECVAVHDNKVVVQGRLADFDEQEMEDLMTNEKIVGPGVEVTSIILNKDGNQASVVFKDGKVAKKLIAQGSVEYAGQTLKIVSSRFLSMEKESQGLMTLEVLNIKPGTHKETVRFFFEDAKKSGGGEIEKFSYNPTAGRALIQFNDSKRARSVVHKHEDKSLQISGRSLQIKEYDEDKLEKYGFSVNSCAVEIQGIVSSDPVDEVHELITDLFNNKNETDGQDLQDVFVAEDLSRAVVTYKSPQTAENVEAVHQRKGIFLNEHKLNVKVMPCSPTMVPDGELEESLLLLMSLPEAIETDTVVDFLENIAETAVQEVIYGMEQGKALVRFKDEPAFDVVFEKLMMYPLSGSMVSPQRVLKSKTIEVYGTFTPKLLTTRTIRMYFENKQKSGGGDVEEIKPLKEKECVLVTFKNYSDASKIEAKSHHAITKQEVVIKLHHQCIGFLPPSHDSSEPMSQIPKEMHFDVENELILAYIMQSPKLSANINEDLKKKYGEVKWTDEAKLGTEVTVVCCLTKAIPNYRSLAKSWEKSVKQCLQGYLVDLMEEHVEVSSETVEDIQKIVDKMTVEQSEVKLVLDKKNALVRMAGNDTAVRDTLQKIKKANENIRRKQERKKKMTKHRLCDITKHDMKYLRACDYKEAMEEKFEDMTVDLDIERGEISVYGTEEDKDSAELEMHRYTKQIKTKYEAVMPEIADMLKVPEVSNYAESVLKAKGHSKVTFDVGRETLTVYGGDNQTLTSALSVLVECICDQSLPLKDDDAMLMRLPKWREEKERIMRKHGKKLNLMDCHSSLRILCTEDIHDEVYNTLTGFLKSNVIEEDFVVTRKAMARLLPNTGNLQRIAEKLSMHSVMLKAHNNSRSGVSIKGSQEGIKAAKEEIHKLLDTVKIKSYEVKKPGMPTYFKYESAGQSQLVAVENRNQVAIEKEADQATSDDSWQYDSGESPVELANIMLEMGRLRLQIIQDNILKLDGEMLLVSATKALSHTDNLADKLVSAAGCSILKECSDHVTIHGNLRVGEVYVSGAGDLSFQRIVHVVFPLISPGNSLAKLELQEAFFESLKIAGKAGMRSLVLPACLFSHSLVAKMFVSAVREYCSRFASSSLSQLTIVKGPHDKLDYLELIVSLLSPGQVAAFRIPEVSGSRPLFTHKRDPNMLTTPEEVKVKLVRGAIAKQSVDVIVNTASSDLQLRAGRVSQSILTAAGDTLQDQCDRILDTTGFHEGMLAETSGGWLDCKKVYHISCTKWTDNEKSAKELAFLITNCLTKASEAGMTSMAFPAVGTGNLGYPRDFVAKAMYEQVNRFSATHPTTCLKQVSFVVYDQDNNTIKAFEKVAKEICDMGYQPVTFPSLRMSQGSMTTSSASTSSGLPRRALSNHTKNLLPRPTQRATQGGAPGGCEISIGQVTIEVVQGDLTQQKTDVIVNSTNRDLAFESPLSKAILKAGGQQFESECQEKESDFDAKVVIQALGLRSDFLSSILRHVAITGAGRMGCKKVIHIDAPGQDANMWKSRILQTLKLGEDNQLRSIAFPALGAGALKMSPAIMSDTMLDAIADFFRNEKPKYLKIIKVVILDMHMFGEWQQEFYHIAASAGSRKRGFLTKGAPIKAHRSRSFSDEASEGEEEEDEGLFPDMEPTTHENLQILALEIFGFEMKNINSAVEQLDKICTEECQEMVLGEKKDEASKIAKLTPGQIEKIKSYEKKYPVVVRVIKDGGKTRISVQGRATGTTGAYLKIKEILQEADELEDRKKEAAKLHQTVKWQYLEDDDYESYPPEINLLIEKAHRAQQAYAKWSEKEGEFRVDFGTMQEYPLGDRSAASAVRRYAPGLIELPETWTDMDHRQQFVVVDLPTSDIDYELVERKFKESMSKKSDYLKKILSIKRIQNPQVFRSYASNKFSVEMKNPTIKQIERELWHGTTETSLDDIHSIGFNRSFCGKNGTVYGKGVYFANDAHLAHSYAEEVNDRRNMYLCRVLTGAFTKGTSDMLLPPYRDEKTKKRYDSVVNKVEMPTIFAVFYDAMAYPEYLITYSANPQ